MNLCMTRRVADTVPQMMQMLLWKIIKATDSPDYLQVFHISFNGKQHIIKHTQEVEGFEDEFFSYPATQEPINAKIYCIDDGERWTMMFADEY